MEYSSVAAENTSTTGQKCTYQMLRLLPRNMKMNGSSTDVRCAKSLLVRMTRYRQDIERGTKWSLGRKGFFALLFTREELENEAAELGLNQLIWGREGYAILGRD